MGCRIFDLAFNEARGFLNDDQYEHLADQIRELAKEIEPSRSQTIDIRPIENFWEIRDKGGILGKINVTIYFFVHKKLESIVILGVDKKEEDGKTKTSVITTMNRRKRMFLEKFPE